MRSQYFMFEDYRQYAWGLACDMADDRGWAMYDVVDEEGYHLGYVVTPLQMKVANAS